MFIRIQTEDFDQAEEYRHLCEATPAVGAIVTFCGLVREFDQGQGRQLHIECFIPMAEKALHDIISQASVSWPISDARIIYRIGTLALGEQIVFVGINSPHRQAAFQACKFIMDYLKTKTPFWKKAIGTEKSYWVDAQESDQQVTERW